MPRKSIQNIKDTKKQSYVIKIICPYNALKKESDTNLRYTITVLPAFLQPYARHTVKDIVNTTDQYINGKITSKHEAAYLLGLESSSGFDRYYLRVINRVDEWVVNLLTKVSEITGTNHYKRIPYEKKTVNHKWTYFIKLIDEYCAAIDTLKTGILLLNEERISFVFALLSMKLKGLGP